MKDDIQRSLGRIEGKVEEGFKNINKRLDGVNDSLKTHDTAINDLQTFKDETKGEAKGVIKIASIGGAIAGGFVTAVVWIASKLFKNS